MGTRCADHVTPLYPQKLALTSPTGDGRSVGIVRARTKATEFSLYAYSLTPWSRILLEKLTGPQPVKKFPQFYGTRRFITAFPILSQTNPFLTHHAIPLREYPPSCYPPICAWVFQVVIFSPGFPTKTLYAPLLPPSTVYTHEAQFS